MKSGDGRRMEREVEKKIEGKIMNAKKGSSHGGMGEKERVGGGE